MLTATLIDRLFCHQQVLFLFDDAKLQLIFESAKFQAIFFEKTAKKSWIHADCKVLSHGIRAYLFAVYLDYKAIVCRMHIFRQTPVKKIVCLYLMIEMGEVCNLWFHFIDKV